MDKNKPEKQDHGDKSRLRQALHNVVASVWEYPSYGRERVIEEEQLHQQKHNPFLDQS